jgi:hypothetical protein
MTRAPLPSAHPIIGFADEARRDSACDSRSGALEQNRNIAAWRERRWRPSRDAFARRKSAPRREGMQDLQRAVQTNPSVCKERTAGRTNPRLSRARCPGSSFGQTNPSVCEQRTLWPNEPDRLRESHDLAKRTRGGANGRCGDPGEIEALYLGGRVQCSFFLLFTMRPKLYI